MPPKSKQKAAAGSAAWLGEFVQEQLQELRALDVFVPDLPEENDISAGGKGAHEKRRLKGNTKSTKKATKEMQRRLLQRRCAQLQALLEAHRPVAATQDEPLSDSDAIAA
jgi:hypothetical protein